MDWYEEEVKGLERKRLQVSYEPKMIFYGSSSIRLWKDLHQDFRPFKPINLGFGGSTLEACVAFFDRIIGPYNPESIVLYAGDNDLGDGKQPQDVLHYYRQLSAKIKKRYKDIPLIFISIKPSISRFHIINKIRQTNDMIREEIMFKEDNYHFINIYDAMTDENGRPRPELFEPDGLHLSAEGYSVWKQIIFREECMLHLGRMAG
jgi:lysophospholipase L1-like esterase